jgi:hypothetical protein
VGRAQRPTQGAGVQRRRTRRLLEAGTQAGHLDPPAPTERRVEPAAQARARCRIVVGHMPVAHKHQRARPHVAQGVHAACIPGPSERVTGSMETWRSRGTAGARAKTPGGPGPQRRDVTVPPQPLPASTVLARPFRFVGAGTGITLAGVRPVAATGPVACPGSPGTPKPSPCADARPAGPAHKRATADRHLLRHRPCRCRARRLRPERPRR